MVNSKDEVNFEFYDVPTWLASTCNTYISQYSTCKGNQTMKYSQLIEYNTRNIFVEKSYTKCAGETIHRFLFKISKLSISLDQYCKVLNSFFVLYANLRAIKIWSQAADYFLLPNVKLFYKTKKLTGTSFPTSFST